MRKFALYASVLSVFAAGMGTTPAAAFGDKCYAPVKATGKGHAMREAMDKARHHWEDHADGRSWNYSGDRRIECSWDAAGTHFKCVASAIPCERR